MITMLHPISMASLCTPPSTAHIHGREGCTRTLRLQDADEVRHAGNCAAIQSRHQDLVLEVDLHGLHLRLIWRGASDAQVPARKSLGRSAVHVCDLACMQQTSPDCLPLSRDKKSNSFMA